MTPKITVIGSVNMDLVTTTENIPALGETVVGASFTTAPGGKGANQAVAAARLGADVTMIGCLGGDQFGTELGNHLERENIFFANMKPVTERSTGIAQITVTQTDNSIIVIPGANDSVTPDLIEKYEKIIAESDIVLMQLEIPLDSVIKAVELAKKHGVLTILNPAPARKLPEELLEKVDYITPNEHEITKLTAIEDQADSVQLFQSFSPKVIMTKGPKGVFLLNDHTLTNVSGYVVKPADTTGAGDAFNGGLAFALGKGMPLEEACQFANAVAALQVTKFGAQTGLPVFNEVESFLQNQQKESHH